MANKKIKRKELTQYYLSQIISLIVLIILTVAVYILFIFNQALLKIELKLNGYNILFYLLIGFILLDFIVTIFQLSLYIKRKYKKKRETAKEKPREIKIKESELKGLKIELSKYETDIDALYKIVEKKQRIKISVIAKYFGVDRKKIEEWAQILEDNHLIEMHYPPVGEPELRNIK